MSMPFKIVSCKKCEFSAPMTCLWGMFEYDLGATGTLELARGLGWCDSCSTIVPAEMLPNARDHAATASAALSAGEDLVERIATLRGGRFTVRRFAFSLGYRSRRISELQKELKSNRETVESHRKMADLLSRRTSPSRCLSCGRSDVHYLEREIPGVRPPARLSLNHPGCGGELWIEKPQLDIRVNIQPVRRRYDAEGRFLSEENFDILQEARRLGQDSGRRRRRDKSWWK